jgi:RHS repeat-associated protein
MILMPAACYRYFIDGLGARVRKVTPSGETWFVYDEAGHLLGEYDSAGNAVQETVYLGDTPVAVLKGTEVFYVYADHLHAPRLIADNAGKSVWQWNSDPFGVTLANADPDGDGVAFNYNLRFPGQYFDSETRLHYNYFRDYNPSSGRYIESDPIGLRGGINTFGYVGGNPLSNIDFKGLAEIIIWEPVGRFASSFGHVSVIANDHSYSWGTGGWDSNKDPQKYIDTNTNFRTGVGVVIPLTTALENKFEACLQNHGGKYNIFTNNCATPSQKCLREIGINDFYKTGSGNTSLGINGNHDFPVDLGNGLLNSDSASSVHDYPVKTEPTTWDRLKRAPWAWGF